MNRTIEQVQADMDAYEGLKTKKEYRQLKEELKALKEAQTGLGDVVEKITEATGIKKAVEVVSEALGVDCGCDRRKQAWNKINLDSIKNIFRNKKVVNEIDDNDYAVLCDLFSNGVPNLIQGRQQRILHSIYKKAFGIGKQATSCGPCMKKTINDLYDLYVINTK